MTRVRNKNEFAAGARAVIREAFNMLPIFARSRTQAVYNYVAVAEADAHQSAAESASIGLAESHRRLVESSSHAIPAIYERCPDREGEKPTIDRAVFEEARSLYDFGHNLSQVEYCFELAERGQYEFFVAQRDPRITFRYASETSDLADTRSRAMDVLSLHQPHAVEPAQVSAGTIIEELKTLVPATYPARCEYQYSDRLHQIVNPYSRAKLTRTNALDIPHDVAVGPLAMHDLQGFWAAIMGIVDVHTAAHCIAANGDLRRLAIDTVVLCQAEHDFAGLISKISGLPSAAVELVMGWYTYRSDAAKDSPILQPFLPLSGGLLCLPSPFVNGNSFERNFRKLMHNHPKLRPFSNSIESCLEDIALNSLSEIFSEPRFRVQICVQIPGLTDVDLLVFDLVTGFTLIIQHKWLLAPDTLRESASNDEKLANGVSQAVKSRDFLRQNASFLVRKLGLPSDQQIRGIEAVVVCRGAEPTGFLESTAVPVINETAFRNLQTKFENLEDLWEQTTTRPDQIEAAKKSAEVQSHIRLCGYEFVIPGLAVQVPLSTKG